MASLLTPDIACLFVFTVKLHCVCQTNNSACSQVGLELSAVITGMGLNVMTCLATLLLLLLTLWTVLCYFFPRDHDHEHSGFEYNVCYDQWSSI